MPQNNDCCAGQPEAAWIDGPVRMCVICRRRLPKKELQRHILTPQGILSPDAAQTRPGRGWYLCSDPACERRFAKYGPGARRRRASIEGGKHA
ncbi:MAG: YlxR family protein [Desulfovibrio sp.]|nr:YlxR family protein [Desulfovibrio sp.]